MFRPAPRTARTALRRALAAAVTGVLLVAVVVALGTNGAADAIPTSAPTSAAPAGAHREVGIVTPGDFTGFGFDQCHAPEQQKMNRWLQSSPFLAVGIYISGDSRACLE